MKTHVVPQKHHGKLLSHMFKFVFTFDVTKSLALHLQILSLLPKAKRPVITAV